MITFHGHAGVRYMVDHDLNGLARCSEVPPFTFRNAKAAERAIDRRNAMPLIEYQVFLGNAEQHRYTYHEKDLWALRQKLEATWDSMKGKWWKQPVEGYPKGSMRFVIKRKAFTIWPQRPRVDRTPILIIPQGARP